MISSPVRDAENAGRIKILINQWLARIYVILTD